MWWPFMAYTLFQYPFWDYRIWPVEMVEIKFSLNSNDNVQTYKQSESKLKKHHICSNFYHHPLIEKQDLSPPPSHTKEV